MVLLVIFRLQRQLSECREECEGRLGEVVREGVARDLRLQSLEDQCDQLKAELARKREDVER